MASIIEYGVSAHIGVSDVNASADVTCTLTMRNLVGSEVASDTASSFNNPSQDIMLHLDASLWDTSNPADGLYPGSVALKCTLPPNGAGYTKMYYYQIF